MEHEIIIPLSNGGSIRCGEGENYQWGGYLRLCDADGNEIVYWDVLEIEEDAEQVVGACFAFAQKTIPTILEELNRTRVVDGCWQ